MSHFTVAVISKKYAGDDVQHLLAKYDEGKRDVFNDCTKEVLKVWETGKTEYGSEIIKEDYDNNIEKFADEWYGYKTVNEGEAKKYGYYYNPDAKWDWYTIGGRWNGLLKLKESVVNEDETVNRKYWWNKDEKDNGLSDRAVNYAKVKDLDFSISEDEYKKNIRFWEVYVEDQEPQNEEEKEMIAHRFYKKEYYINRYKNKETYAKLVSEFSTFAVLTDKGWFEKGEMGGFGCSSETDEESFDWDTTYYNRFIKDLDPETYITVVDCHI